MSSRRRPGPITTGSGFNATAVTPSPGHHDVLWLWVPDLRFASLRLSGTTGRLLSLLPLPYQPTEVHHFRLADGRWRAREARGGGGLGHAVALDENLACGHVRMLRRFRHGENRREADVGAFHDLAPVRAALALEDPRQFLLQRRPGLAVHLRVEIGIGQPGMLAQESVELRLDRADRDEIAAGAFIDAVEMRAAVQEILVAAFHPAADGAHVEEHRHQ